MRGVPLRFVRCQHWQVNLIAHPPSRLLYDPLCSGHLFKVKRPRPVGCQEASFHYRGVPVSALHHSFRFGVYPFLYQFGMRHAIFDLRSF